MSVIIAFSIISIILGLLILCKQINPLIRDGSLVGTIASTAILGRISMASIPNVQPATFLILIAGYTYGCATGFVVGFCTALVSNFALLQGPWTIWQAFAWGLVGASGGVLKLFMAQPKRNVLVGAAFAWGYLFGAIMDIFGWLFFMPIHTFSTYLTMFASSFGFNTAHAVGNALFMFVLGIPIIYGIEQLRTWIFGLCPQESKKY